MSVKNVASAQKVSRITIWKIKHRYKQYGEESLFDHQSGRLFEPLNSKFYDLVVSEWKKNKCGARKLYAVLKRKGFSVSLRKISQVLIKEGFQKQCIKRRMPRKYKRYEWPLPNYMWHTDWHVIKASKLTGENILVYIDDCSRRIMGYIVGAETSYNARIALYNAINTYCVIPFILNSDRGAQFFPNKKDKHGNALHEFQETLNDLGIIFVPSKIRHPQTNGKNEKFFDILDKEFDERFETIADFIKWYNDERLSEAVDYMTPAEAYKKRL